LDAGCGTGTLSRNLADRGAQVVGIDASPEMVARARQLTSDRGLCSNLEFQISSIVPLPFSSSSLHGILCSSVIEYVEDVPASLLEFARVLRPGGLLLVSVPNKPSIIRQFQVGTHRLVRIMQREVFPFVEHSRHHYTQQSFRRLLEQSGFATSRVITFGSPIPVWLQRNRFVGSLLMFSAVRREV
jgi:2-polyprenyl-6-hydroxyphenyl methylase/3-demethylubiquinone-9 3-methyltransferase